MHILIEQHPEALLQQTAFYLIAILMILGAIAIVSFRNIFHSALSLALVALGAAKLYFILDAEFIAIIQILINIGVLITIITFVIILTQRSDCANIKQTNEQKFLALLVCGSLLGLLLWKLPNVVWRTVVTSDELADITTIGQALLTTYILPFEVMAIILLIVLLGAIVLAKKETK